MKNKLQCSSLALVLMFAGCSSHEEPAPDPEGPPPTIDTVSPPGIEDASCAGAAPVMEAPDET